MRDGTCDRTEAVLQAAATGSRSEPPALPPELEAHIRSCTGCADALLVAGVLARDAAALVAAPGPAAGEAVWRRARARLDAEALARATRPIAVVRKLAWAVGAVAWCGAVWRLAPEAAPWLERLGRLEWLGGGWQWRLPAGAGFEGEGALLVAGAAVLFVLFYGVYAVWAEEG
jgi:hypothetical protein